jgi:hypothetical protein
MISDRESTATPPKELIEKTGYVAQVSDNIGKG